MTTLKLSESDAVCDQRAEVGEGPVWDERINRLYWIDITQGRLFWLEENSSKAQEWKFDGMIGTVALTHDPGTVLVALENGLHFFTLATESLQFFAHPAAAEKGNRYNDGKPDRLGRLWIGSMHPEGKEGQGSLYCCHPDGSSQLVQTGLSIPNGLDWSPDGKTFYFVDSPTKCLQAFSFLEKSGEVKEVISRWDFSSVEGVPDGLTVDREGKIWIAFWGGHCVKAFDPGTGENLCAITLPPSQSSSCAFGGRDLSCLYITSAGHQLSAPEPSAGLLFQSQPHGNGRPANRFGKI